MSIKEVKHNRMLLTIEKMTRRPGPVGEDFLTLTVQLTNPIGPPGSLQRGPSIQLRDAAGRVFDVTAGRELTRPVAPGESIAGALSFETAEDSVGLQMLLAPGTEDEVVVELPDTLRD